MGLDFLLWRTICERFSLVGQLLLAVDFDLDQAYTLGWLSLFLGAMVQHDLFWFSSFLFSSDIACIVVVVGVYGSSYMGHL